jgi:hypothetical protein
MTVQALVIQPGDEHGTMTPVDAGSLKALQDLVGGYVESVRFLDARALMNEEGKELGLQANPLATSLARSAGAIFPDDSICGPMVLIGVDAAGENIDVPKRLVEQLRDAGIEVRG